MNNMRIETWCGYEIRFVEVDGEWWAVLKDICDALGLKTFKISQRLDPSMMLRVPVEMTSQIKRDDIPSRYNVSEITKNFWMLAVNEIGIYEALFASRKLEARKFRRWSGTVMQKLRSQVGLKQYEVMRMTDPTIQQEIDYILDTIFWDDEKKMLMQSITVPGGDVEQIPFEG